MITITLPASYLNADKAQETRSMHDQKATIYSIKYSNNTPIHRVKMWAKKHTLDNVVLISLT